MKSRLSATQPAAGGNRPSSIARHLAYKAGIFALFALRAQVNFLNPFNVICPVQPSPKKYSPSLLTQITGLYVPVSPHTEGRIMIVTNAGWDAVDAAALGA